VAICNTHVCELTQQKHFLQINTSKGDTYTFWSSAHLQHPSNACQTMAAVNNLQGLEVTCTMQWCSNGSCI